MSVANIAHLVFTTLLDCCLGNNYHTAPRLKYGFQLGMYLSTLMKYYNRNLLRIIYSIKKIRVECSQYVYSSMCVKFMYSSANEWRAKANCYHVIQNTINMVVV